MNYMKYDLQLCTRMLNARKSVRVAEDFLFDIHVCSRIIYVLSCQPRVTVTSCLICKVIRYLESIDHLCINPIHRIRVSSSGVNKLMVYLTIVKIYYFTVTFGWHDSSISWATLKYAHLSSTNSLYQNVGPELDL